MVGTRKRIQLLKVDNVKLASGSWGQPVKTRYNFWAEVEHLSGSSAYKNSQTSLGSSYRFKIRYNPQLDLSAKWSLVYNGKQFTVTSIQRESEKNFYVIIEAQHG